MTIEAKPSPWCRRCRRALRNPASIAVGMGPTCAAKTGAKATIPETQYFPVGPVRHIPTVTLQPGKYYVAFPADADPRPIASIHAIALTVHPSGAREARYLDPRLDIDRRSPTGFQYGYGGSGPSQLALAILCDFFEVILEEGKTGLFTARAEYQRFKFEFLGRTQPPDLLIISEQEVRDWLAKEGIKTEPECPQHIGSPCPTCGE